VAATAPSQLLRGWVQQDAGAGGYKIEPDVAQTQFVVYGTPDELGNLAAAACEKPPANASVQCEVASQTANTWGQMRQLVTDYRGNAAQQTNAIADRRNRRS